MKVVIIGGRGTAINIADQMVDAHDRFGMDIEVLGLALDDRSGGNSICGYPILCGIRDLHSLYGKYEDVRYVYSLYRTDVIPARTQLLHSLDIPKERFCNFIHPSAVVAKSTRMGFGNILMAHVVLHSKVSLGNFNTIYSGAMLGYGTCVGDNNFITSQACIGNSITIGKENFIGLNSCFRGKLYIGDRNLIGMGTVVTKDIEDNVIAYGNPARQRPRS